MGITADLSRKRPATKSSMGLKALGFASCKHFARACLLGEVERPLERPRDFGQGSKSHAAPAGWRPRILIALNCIVAFHERTSPVTRTGSFRAPGRIGATGKDCGLHLPRMGIGIMGIATSHPSLLSTSHMHSSVHLHRRLQCTTNMTTYIASRRMRDSMLMDISAFFLSLACA